MFPCLSWISQHSRFLVNSPAGSVLAWGYQAAPAQGKELALWPWEGKAGHRAHRAVPVYCAEPARDGPHLGCANETLKQRNITAASADSTCFTAMAGSFTAKRRAAWVICLPSVLCGCCSTSQASFICNLFHFSLKNYKVAQPSVKCHNT